MYGATNICGKSAHAVDFNIFKIRTKPSIYNWPYAARPHVKREVKKNELSAPHDLTEQRAEHKQMSSANEQEGSEASDAKEGPESGSLVIRFYIRRWDSH